MRLELSGDGPPVIKLAGIVGGVGLYREETAEAAAAGFRVASLDNTGDRWDDPAPAPVDWDFLADEVSEAIQRAGGPPAILWGTSFGSVLAMAVAARHPRRVAGLLLSFPPEPCRAPRPYRAAIRRALRSRRPDRALQRIFTAGFYTLCGWEFAYPPALRRLPHLYRAGRDASTPTSTLRRKLHLLWEVDPGTPSVKIPASVIAGAWDPVAPPGGARRVARRVEALAVRWLRFAGHAGAFSRPRTYTRWAVEELQRLAATAEDGGAAERSPAPPSGVEAAPPPPPGPSS